MPLHRSIKAFPGFCMVASASAGISGVCSVAGRVGEERLLEVLFPIELIARNVARRDVDKPKLLTRTNHANETMRVGPLPQRTFSPEDVSWRNFSGTFRDISQKHFHGLDTPSEEDLFGIFLTYALPPPPP